MIRINLLPQELQQAARTPVKLFVTIVAGIILVLLTSVAYGYLFFNTMVLAERVERKHEEVEHLKANAAEVDSLLDDIQDYKQREHAIIGIKTNRVLWSRRLDELAQLTPKHIWILSIHVSESINGKGAILDNSGGFLELVCFSSGKEVNRITNFRQKLKNVDEFYANFIDEPIRMENFYSDFINITRPEWQLVMLNKFREPHNLKFTVRLDLRLLEDDATVES
jgi:Tfp pilus assembly protein PilN